MKKGRHQGDNEGGDRSKDTAEIEDDDSLVIDLATVKPLVLNGTAWSFLEKEDDEDGRSEAAVESEDDDSLVIDLTTVKSLTLKKA